MILDTNNIWDSPQRKIEAGVLQLSSTSKSIYGENSLELTDVCPRNPKFKCVVQGRNLLNYFFPQAPVVINGVTFTVNNDASISASGTAGAGGATFYFTEEKSKFWADGGYDFKAFVVEDEDPITLYGDMLCAELIAPDGTITHTIEFNMYGYEGTELLPYIKINEGMYVNFTIKPQLLFCDDYDIEYNTNKYTMPLNYINEIKLIINGTEYAINSDGTVDNILRSSDVMSISTSVQNTGIYITYNCVEWNSVFTGNDYLKSLIVERLGEEGKFFGAIICQKLNLQMVDKNRELNFSTKDGFMGIIGNSLESINMFAPLFYVSEVHRDENTNELSITAYDLLYDTNKHTVAELGLVAPYTIREVVEKCAALIGAYGVIIPEYSQFDLVYENGANLEGTETIREILSAIAEATLTIGYLDINNFLVFKRLDKDGNPVLTITKEDYFTLDSKTNCRLSAIVSATELGNNIGANLDEEGMTQYVRDNPFLELREDVAQWVDEALATVGGLTINQFDCTWRGNPGLEPGDKIALIAKDDSEVISYVLYDTLTYTGGLSQKTSWHYENGAESQSNPSSLGEALKKTFSRVDKVNKEIEIVAAETTQLKLDNSSISASVSNLTTTVSTKMNSNDVNIAIQKTLADGVNKVVTATGFKFDDDGLSITKSDSEINTIISEDGMTIRKKNKEVLRADNEGVKATDLHATTYMIVGKNSRFENFKNNRTACIWIG